MSSILLRRVLAVGLLGTLPVLAGCDDEELMPPTATAGATFARYVAIGNSITAGYQSGGINDSTQAQSYAALLAAELGTEFNQPLMNYPGCPAPYTDVFTGTRILGTGPTDCAMRMVPIPTVLHNVAVPGAAVIDVINNAAADSDPNALTTFFLGGRTQIQAARAVHPTFATVWIGNNDVLGAALVGDATLVTNAATFATRYNAMVDSLAAVSLQGAVLIGVVDVTAIPYLSPGVAYWLAARAPTWPPTFNVSANCGPAAAGGVGDQVLVPFGYGFGVLMAQAAAGTPVTLNCATDPPVLSAAELVTMGTAVAAYNQTISAAAADQGWAYWNPNPALLALKASGTVPQFPDLTGGPPFGTYMSQDGVHPALPAHQLIRDSLLAVIEGM